ncbi:MAG: hypothetical protein E7G69_05180, partial [Enterobacter sp.]|nr:hypothetical protein [Enterobacter sp.]
QHAGTLTWGGVYGHSWFFDPQAQLTVVSAVVFMLLKPKDGRNLIKERHKEKAKPNRVPSEQE